MQKAVARGRGVAAFPGAVAVGNGATAFPRATANGRGAADLPGAVAKGSPGELSQKFCHSRDFWPNNISQPNSCTLAIKKAR